MPVSAVPASENDRRPGLSLLPDRWSLEPYGEANTLTFLTTLDAETHHQLEQVLEHRQADENAENYFPVILVGVSDNPASMRFGKCLWQSRDDGGARHRIVLVPENGDDQLITLEITEPEQMRLIQQSVTIKLRLDALIEELHRTGVLDDAAIGRLTREITRLPFAEVREFARVDDVDDFFH